MFSRIVIAVALVASFASAQINIRDRSDPFLNFNTQNQGAFGGGAASTPLQGRIAIKFPEAVSVSRPLKLRPPKPVMVLEKQDAPDTKLTALDQGLRAAAGKLGAARKARDFAATRRLLREMESLRQERLAHIRTVATLVIPDPPESDDLPSGGADSSAPPLLPLPTAPKSLGS